MFSHRILPLTLLIYAGFGHDAQAQTKINATDMIVNGESFFAIANIDSELTRLARADGTIGAKESFRQIAVSGAVMTGILSQYKNCTPKPVYMITDGGGNDLMGSCGATPTADCAEIKSALATVQQYFTEMKNSGTKKIIWMRYPDPYGSQWATLKANQDVYNPEVEKICHASEVPKCQWIDMRTTWAGHYAGYTTDGIHPTDSGGTATAEAFWKAIKDSSFFTLSSTALNETRSGTPTFRSPFIFDRSLQLSVFLEHPALVTLSMTTLTGKTILRAKSQAEAGNQNLQFAVGRLAPGIYRLDLQAGTSRKLVTELYTVKAP